MDSWSRQGIYDLATSHNLGATDPCGGPGHSLADARQMVDDEVDDIPENFVFVVKGAPLLVQRKSTSFFHFSLCGLAAMSLMRAGDDPSLW